jgi:hypothetical protein
MYKELDSLNGLLKLDPVSTDNVVFRLHYKATTIILIAFTFLVTCRQYDGNSIYCISDRIAIDVMSSSCVVMSIFTLPHRQEGGEYHIVEFQPY